MTRASLLIVVFLGLSARPLASQDAESLRVDCLEGDAIACTSLGAMYANGIGVTRDLARALSLLQQACDGGEMRGCFGLGLLYSSGQGVTQDLARALSLFQQVCDDGLVEACQEGARVVSVYLQACDRGDMRGCFGLAQSYRSGDGVPRDLARAVSLYEQGLRRRRDAGLHRPWAHVRDRRGRYSGPLPRPQPAPASLRR